MKLVDYILWPLEKWAELWGFKKEPFDYKSTTSLNSLEYILKKLEYIASVTNDPDTKVQLIRLQAYVDDLND